MRLFKNLIVAIGVATIAAAPALAQDQGHHDMGANRAYGERGIHNDVAMHGQPGMRGDLRQDVRHDVRSDRYNRGRHSGWRNGRGHHRNCRTVWRHHHRMTRCW